MGRVGRDARDARGDDHDWGVNPGTDAVGTASSRVERGCFDFYLADSERWIY